MIRLGRSLRRLGIAFGLLIVLVIAVFGLLQTPPGQRWLGQAIAAAVSSPDFKVSIERIDGIVPFRFGIGRIDIADAAGPYAALRDLAVRIAPRQLLSGRVRIQSLSISEIDIARLPDLSGSSRPLADYLRVPRLPAAVAVERLAVGRLLLAPPVLGDRIVATIDGRARIAGDIARVSFDLHRIDGRRGRITLDTTIGGAPPVLALHFAAEESAGILIDRLLKRRDHLPLALSLEGTGPIADWHGRLTGSAGHAANLDAQLHIAAAAETDLGLVATGSLAGFVPPEVAPLIGVRPRLSLQARFGRRIVLDRLSIEAAAGTLTGNAAWDRAEDRLTARLHGAMPNLSPLSPLLASQLGGSATFSATLSGRPSRPVLSASLSVTGARMSGSGASRVEATISATPRGPLDVPRTRIDVTASGHIRGLNLTHQAVLPSTLGRDFDVSLSGSVTPDGDRIDLTRLSAQGMGLDLAGSGTRTGPTVSGRINLSAADLRPFGGLLGHPLLGSARLAINATGRSSGGFAATLDGSTRDLKTGIAGADALFGGATTMRGIVNGTLDGVLDADRIEIEGKAARLSGKAQFDPATQRLGATLALDVPRLEPLGAALGAPMAGETTIRLTAAGVLDRLAVNSEFDGRAIAAAGISLDRVRLALRLPDLAAPRAALDGSFGARGIDGTVALTALPEGGDIAVPDFRLTAAGGSVTGALRIRRDTGLVRGRITGRIPDLARWSAIAGRPLGGSCEFVAGLDTNGGQRLDLSAKATSLASGTGTSRLVIGRLDAAVRLADLRRSPTVSGRLALAQGRFGTIAFTNARLNVETPRPGHITFNGDAKGQPLSVGFAGEAALAPAAFELRLDRLDGSLGRARLALQKPLLVSRRATDFSVSGLDLRLAGGRITGSGGFHGDALELAVDAADLPLAATAHALGYREVKGELSAAVRVSGNLRAPQGRLTLTARDLDLAGQAPTGFGLAMTGNWDGRDLAARGQITGLTGDSIVFGGSVPLRLRQAPLGISLPADGRLALNLRGKGRLDHLADLLPLGEDRVSGRFSADVSVGGTLASPAASGHLTLTDARWENFASGAVLTKVAADIAGDRDRFQLTSFTAADPGGGHIEARGSLALNRAAGPTIELSARLAQLRIAARDEAIVTASGSVAVVGPIGNPKITGRLTIDKGEINLPQAPPSSLARLDVTVIDSKTGKRPAPASSAAAIEMLSAALDLQLDAPGPIFVRGHGLDSQWRGRLTIRGTSAAPDITGQLEQIQGSFDLLGRTFQLTRGAIVFGGGAKLDPTLNIVAEASAADITAQIVVSGPASAPKIKLLSTPALPQDEILARVLFGQSVGRISAAQGLQLAQAAAALAGGGPGVLDRLRGKLGLDWLRLGEGPSGPASSILNPALANPAGTNNAAVSAGKYLMPGVSVGVTQGVAPPTSKVTVQIEVRPHVTVQGEAGQSGNTGIGLNYQYDY